MHPDIKTIVCSVDFSMHTPPVFRYGIELARRFKAHLVVFHSVYFRSDQVFYTDGAENREQWKQLPTEALEKIEAYMAETSVSWEPVIEHGEPVGTLERIAQERNADLIVAASHGLSGFQRLFLGTVLERAAKHVPRPILALGHLAGNAPTFPVKRIVAGCGLKIEKDPVASFANTIARCFQADLHLVHVAESPVNESVIDPAAGPYTRVQDELKHRLENHLIHETVADHLKPGIHTSVLTGVPGEALVRYAKDNDADMIVLGIRQSETLKRAFLGSTVETLLRRLPCSVLTVPQHLPGG